MALNIGIASVVSEGSAAPAVKTKMSFHFNDKGDVTQRGMNRKSLRYKILGRMPDTVRRVMEMPALPESEVPSSLPWTRSRHILWLIFTETDSLAGLGVFLMVFAAILLSVIAFCIQTLPENRLRFELGLYGAPEQAFDVVEQLCVSIFTIDYLVRLLTATTCLNEYEQAYVRRFGFTRVGMQLPPLTFDYGRWSGSGGMAAFLDSTVKKTLGFVFSLLNLIDVAAIIPFYVGLATGANLGNVAIIRVLRLARVARLLRLTKGMEGLTVLANTMLASLDALGFLMFFVLLACILFGSMVFFCESGEFDPVERVWKRPTLIGDTLEQSPFYSIPHSMWYTMVTMTTVGYGDMFPTTAAGKVIGTCTMLCGIMVLALPITVIGSSFTEEYSKYKEKMRAKDDEIAKRIEAAQAAEAALQEALLTVRNPMGPVLECAQEVQEVDEEEEGPAAAGVRLGGVTGASGRSGAVASSSDPSPRDSEMLAVPVGPPVRAPVLVKGETVGSLVPALPLPALSRVASMTAPAADGAPGSTSERGSTALNAPLLSLHAQLGALVTLIKEQSAEIAELRAAVRELKGSPSAEQGR